MKLYKEFFGKRLEVAIREVGIKQYQLAEELGVDSPNVSRWISGKHFPSDENFDEICRVLDLKRDYFLQSEQPQTIQELSKIIAVQDDEIKNIGSAEHLEIIRALGDASSVEIRRIKNILGINARESKRETS